MPKPIFRLITVNVTGKVKLIAARGSVPSKLTKKVSTKPKLIIMIIPRIIGMVMRFKMVPTSPSVKLVARTFFFESVTSVSIKINPVGLMELEQLAIQFT